MTDRSVMDDTFYYYNVSRLNKQKHCSGLSQPPVSRVITQTPAVQYLQFVSFPLEGPT